MQKVKNLAHKQGKTMTELVNELLAEGIRRRETAEPNPPFELPSFPWGVPGSTWPIAMPSKMQCLTDVRPDRHQHPLVCRELGCARHRRRSTRPGRSGPARSRPHLIAYTARDQAYTARDQNDRRWRGTFGKPAPYRHQAVRLTHVHERISNGQAGESAEVTVRRQEFRDTTFETNCRNSGVVNHRPADLASVKQFGQLTPMIESFH